MSDAKLVKTRLKAGVWEGEFHLPEDTGAAPEIDVTHRGELVQGHTLTPDPERKGVYLFRFAIPMDRISDGVEVFLFTERESGARLGECALLADEPPTDDLRAEVELLREELNMLKRAFRRHCIETGSA